MIAKQGLRDLRVIKKFDEALIVGFIFFEDFLVNELKPLFEQLNQGDQS
jgi:hypothetical protein